MNIILNVVKIILFRNVLMQSNFIKILTRNAISFT